jgi:hypothetical protein
MAPGHEGTTTLHAGSLRKTEEDRPCRIHCNTRLNESAIYNAGGTGCFNKRSCQEDTHWTVAAGAGRAVASTLKGSGRNLGALAHVGRGSVR